jgi:hypothetical protein
MMNINWFKLTLLCATLILVGCGEKQTVFPTAKLEGTITIKGEALDKGMIQVISKDKIGLVVQTQIADGKFIIPDAPLGEVTILVRATKPTGKMIKEYSNEYPEVINIIPKSYQQGVPYTVKKEGEPLILDWK